MNDASKNKWIAVVTSFVVVALFFGGIFIYSANQKMEQVEKTALNEQDTTGLINAESQTTEDISFAQPSSFTSITTNNQKVMNSITTPEGLIIEDRVIGVGAEIKNGQEILVHYVGTLENGTKFDSSLDRGEPIEFVFGVGQVIKGWDQGLQGMKVGGKRRLVIPAPLAYGNRAVGNLIPANSTLIFEVELVGIT